MTRFALMVAAVVVAVASVPVWASASLVTSFDYVGTVVLVALGLVLLTGMAGLTSFGQAAFCGVGAYATAVLTTGVGWSAVAALPVSLGATALAAVLIGALTIRLAGHYLVLGTLAWGTGISYVLGNTPGLGGFNGIVGLPPVVLAGWALDTPRAMYWLVWFCVGGACLLSANLLDSRVGRAIRSLPAPGMAESTGVGTAALKLQVFVAAALLAGLSGWLQAHLVRVVNPGPFGIHASIDDLFAVVIGGVGSLGGALLGPVVFGLLQDWLRGFLPWLVGRSGSFEVAAFGLLVMAMLQFASTGLMPLLARVLPQRAARRAVVAPALPRRAQPARGSALLAAEGLTKRFGGLVAVDGAGLSVAAGEIVAVIGPNGAGKSTLFNLLTGVAAPDAGRIGLAGQWLGRRTARQMAAAGVARTFQHVKLRPGMTALENAALGTHRRGRRGALAAALRLDRGEEARLLHEAQLQLERVGLGALATARAGNLALGQQRLLEVARALAADPVLLLLDEPAAGLRHAEKQAFAGLLAALRADGLSILLVEHDMGFVMGLVDRVVVMEFGRVIADGTPEVVRRDARVMAAYLGAV